VLSIVFAKESGSCVFSVAQQQQQQQAQKTTQNSNKN